jgi:hypothetical protein
LCCCVVVKKGSEVPKKTKDDEDDNDDDETLVVVVVVVVAAVERWKVGRIRIRIPEPERDGRWGDERRPRGVPVGLWPGVRTNG